MKVAVVGSGVSGLAATWLLNEYSDHEVHLFEEEFRPGGHANTVEFVQLGKEPTTVDTGFIVLNPTTYPNFLRFLKMCSGVEILPTEMTFAVSRDNGAFEWAGNNLMTVFCQPSRLLDPNMWRLIYDVLRFNACARRLIIGWKDKRISNDLSIGQYLENEGYSASFRDNYLIPMTAAIWSMPPDKCAMDFPARTLIQFMYNHHLLQLIGKPSWLTIKGGSHAYVKAILSKLPEHCLHLGTGIKSVDIREAGPKIQLHTSDGQPHEFDHVIFACHSDTTLNILNAGSGPTDDERRILSRFQWNRNIAVLHSDKELMPRERLAWSCWNVLSSSTQDRHGNVKVNEDQISLTYWMNALQHLSEAKHGPVLVTLNPPHDPDPKNTVGWYKYSHPVLDSEAVKSQNEMRTIQGKRGISFAGAWTRYGFHEDGFTSGLRAVIDHLNVNSPFELRDPDREPMSVRAAAIFDVLEQTGFKVAVGSLLACWLSVIRFTLSFVVDLSHVDNPSKVKIE
ncbi:FAD/NAD(P)-binding domain-containing protein [Neolentinus lepideus HHB14362 ss-1]|uniref:FAD/NAD(P)-binding domain-containing protein n=1 Tax=Neolentinus lepideus HHB14362 ss-1 TaxID=1314782 RepID=A0A165SN90_9AGAM|nr:FAD/NAD(P)-binding domain-containing protein [Neolentinus lepideus HHB14362 ss-1]